MIMFFNGKISHDPFGDDLELLLISLDTNFNF